METKIITLYCVRCKIKFRFWTKGNIYPIICEDCLKELKGENK